MNVLITGGAGYIGAICAEIFTRAGHGVSAYDNLSEGHRAALPPGVRLFEGDILDASAFRRALESSRPDVVAHLAASALVGESMQDPAKYFRNNVSGTQAVLQACVESGVRRVIFSSSCATYGIPVGEQIITETTPQDPINPYGESKRMCERMLDWHRRIHGLEFVAFRFFNAAGATQERGEHHHVETHLIPNVLRVAAGTLERCDVLGGDYPTSDGTCQRDYIHVEDLAEAFKIALSSQALGFFNLGNDTPFSVLEVIRTAERVTGKKIETRMLPRRPGDPPRLVASSARARAELGWRPRHTSLEKIIESAWRWHQSHPRGFA
ncbi:MAG: UDP-glucose 4-epimerase GalE [Verrucomicrobia bacterium]|nr:UDP-glucose 4-epimerase GalE [Verrucomicrobiota bacterium]